MKTKNNCYCICYFFVATIATICYLIYISGSYGGISGNPVFSTIPPFLLQEGVFSYSATVIATLGLRKFHTMRPYVLAKLNRRKEDLSKRWFIRFSAWSNKEGKLITKEVYCPAKFKTAKQRERWANPIIEEINKALEQGQSFDDANKQQSETEAAHYTIEECVNLAVTIKARTLRKKSLSTYTGKRDKFLEWLGENKKKGIDYITKRRVLDYIAFLQDSPEIESNVTINNILNVTKGFFLLLKKEHFIKENPFLYTPLQETENYRNRAFTERDQLIVERIMQEKAPGLYLFTRIMYYNFIRPNELRQIRLRDIDFKRKTITIFGDGAKNHRQATIPIHPRLFQLIEEFKDLPKFFYLIGKGLKPGANSLSENAAYNKHCDILFTAENDNNLSLDEKDYTLYSWRHSGAIRAYEAGTDIKTLQFLFRHTTVQTTEIYLKSLRLNLNNVILKDW